MNVLVEGAWEGDDLGGRISLLVPLGEARNQSVAEGVERGEQVNPAGLERLLAPLGSFRAGLAARFDLRFLSFDIELVFHDPKTGRACTVRGAENDPEGRSVAPCIRCRTAAGSESVCREGTAWPARVSGSEEALSQLVRALADKGP